MKLRYVKEMLEKEKGNIVSDRESSENSESVTRIKIQQMVLEMEQKLYFNFKN